jgi:hypothetical protein
MTLAGKVTSTQPAFTAGEALAVVNVKGVCEYTIPMFPGAVTVMVVLVALMFCRTLYVPFGLHVMVSGPLSSVKQKSPQPYRALNVKSKMSFDELVAFRFHTTRNKLVGSSKIGVTKGCGAQPLKSIPQDKRDKEPAQFPDKSSVPVPQYWESVSANNAQLSS